MISLEDAQKKLEYYCTYQERCHQEVTRKLQQLQVPYRDHGQIIARLIADDFLNETRFAILFAGGKFRTKKWGKERIELELKQRAISAWNIRNALAQIEDEEYEATFLALLERLQNQYQNETKPLVYKKKIHDALRYRGWEADRIYQALRNIEPL